MPVIDTLLVMAARFLERPKGRIANRFLRMFVADRNHLHHAIEGLAPHRPAIVGTIYSLVLASCVLALVVALTRNASLGVIVLAIEVAVLGAVRWLGKRSRLRQLPRRRPATRYTIDGATTRNKGAMTRQTPSVVHLLKGAMHRALSSGRRLRRPFCRGGVQLLEGSGHDHDRGFLAAFVRSHRQRDDGLEVTSPDVQLIEPAVAPEGFIAHARHGFELTARQGPQPPDRRFVHVVRLLRTLESAEFETHRLSQIVRAAVGALREVVAARQVEGGAHSAQLGLGGLFGLRKGQQLAGVEKGRRRGFGDGDLENRTPRLLARDEEEERERDEEERKDAKHGPILATHKQARQRR